MLKKSSRDFRTVFIRIKGDAVLGDVYTVVTE
jgi:hypothetical protein